MILTFGGLFHTTFLLEVSFSMLLISWNFKGSFLILILAFENFEIVFLIRIPTSWGVCFITFLFEPSFSRFLDFKEMKDGLINIYVKTKIAKNATTSLILVESS